MLNTPLSNTLHLWLIRFKSFSIAHQKDLVNLLSPEEDARRQRFVNQIDQERYAISHGYLRKVLSLYTDDITPKDWCFNLGQHGKPTLADHHGLSLSFNLSHSAHFAVIAISTLGEIGVDIEEPRGGIDIYAVAKSVFNKQEQTYLNALPSHEAIPYFTQTWTLKEAYLKALGTGFSVEPSTFSTVNDKTFLTKHFLASCEIEDGVFISVAKLNCETKQDIRVFEYQENKGRQSFPEAKTMDTYPRRYDNEL